MSTGFLPINLANVQTATGYDYKPGTYMLQVESVEVKANNDGQGQRLVVNNVIVMGPGPSTEYQNRKIANSYQITEKGAPFLKRMFVCAGITEEYIAQNGGNVSPDWLVGRQYVAQVVKNGNYTNITSERPISEWDTAIKQGAISAPGNGAPAMPPPSVLQQGAMPAMQAFAPPAMAPQGQQAPTGFAPPAAPPAGMPQMQPMQSMQPMQPMQPMQSMQPMQGQPQSMGLPTPQLPPAGTVPQGGFPPPGGGLPQQ
jgi:hypothetical protein